MASARGPLPELPKVLLEELVKGPMAPAEVQDLMPAFNKAAIEPAMGTEMNLYPGSPGSGGRPAPHESRCSAACVAGPIVNGVRSGGASPASTRRASRLRAGSESSD